MQLFLTIYEIACIIDSTAGQATNHIVSQTRPTSAEVGLVIPMMSIPMLSTPIWSIRLCQLPTLSIPTMSIPHHVNFLISQMGVDKVRIDVGEAIGSGFARPTGSTRLKLAKL